MLRDASPGGRHGREALRDGFYTWTQRQAEHLRTGRLDDADLENIAEEIESLGKSQATALRSADRLIAMHLLKLMVRPGRATKSWRASIIRDRSNVEAFLTDGPGLKPRRMELSQQAYGAARGGVRNGSAARAIPVDLPFTVDQAETDHFWPMPAPRSP